MRNFAQLRPANTTAAALYRVGVYAHDRQYCIAPLKCCLVHVVNTSGATAAFRIVHSPKGDDFDEEHAIAWDKEMLADTDTLIAVPDILSGQLGVRTDTASAITFTLEGV